MLHDEGKSSPTLVGLGLMLSPKQLQNLKTIFKVYLIKRKGSTSVAVLELLLDLYQTAHFYFVLELVVCVFYSLKTWKREKIFSCQHYEDSAFP